MKNLRIFEMLVNAEISNVEEMWADREEKTRYSFGWLKKEPEGGGTIGSLHSDSFHYVEEIIDIARATGVNICLSIRKNLDGIPTPVIIAF